MFSSRVLMGIPWEGTRSRWRFASLVTYREDDTAWAGVCQHFSGASRLPDAGPFAYINFMAARTFTFLGTGTSTGVPMVGCDCSVCTSSDPRNHRYRCAVLIKTPQGNI